MDDFKNKFADAVIGVLLRIAVGVVMGIALVCVVGALG